MDPLLLLRPLRVADSAAVRPSLLWPVKSLERIRQQHPLLGTLLTERSTTTASRITPHRDLRMIAMGSFRTSLRERFLKGLTSQPNLAPPLLMQGSRRSAPWEKDSRVRHLQP